MNLTFQKHPAEVFCKKGALKNFANFTGKTVVLDSLLKKFADPRTFNFIKKRLKHSCFSVKSEKIFKNTYFEEHLRTTASIIWSTSH